MQNICKTSNVKNIIKIIKKNIVLLQIIKHKRIHSTNIYRQQTYFFLTTQYNLAHTTNTNTTYTREFLYYSLYAFINIHFLFFWFWTFGVQCHVSVALIFSLIHVHVPIRTSTLQKTQPKLLTSRHTIFQENGTTPFTTCQTTHIHLSCIQQP